MSTENQKVSEEQLNILRSLQSQFDVLTKRYGELHFEQRLLDRALDSLEERRREAVLALQEQFGSTGTVDLSTGEFIPD